MDIKFELQHRLKTFLADNPYEVMLTNNLILQAYLDHTEVAKRAYTSNIHHYNSLNLRKNKHLQFYFQVQSLYQH